MLKKPLSPRHFAELQSSGISADVIADMGCWTETDPRVLRSLGFSEPQSKCIPCLVIPNSAIDGRTCYQIKPDRPFRNEDGKPVKYMAPAGGSYCLGVLPSVRTAVLDPSVRLIITEGAKKAAAGVSRGLACISVSGVWMWRVGKKIDPYQPPLPDWASIPLDGREVWICFDSDAMRKEDVHSALKELVHFLNSRGAVVKIVYLPDGEDGEKCGIDDFFLLHNVADLELLADSALHPIQPQITQEIVKALQKRTKGVASVTATGVTFPESNAKALDCVAKSLRNIESQVRGVASWIWGDLWIEMKSLVPHGLLWTTFSGRYGQDAAKRASDASKVNRAFPQDNRRGGCIPHWVFKEIVTADKETQTLILDTYEAEGLGMREIRQIIENRKHVDSEIKTCRKFPATSPDLELIHDAQALLDKIPAQYRADLTWYLSEIGFDPIEELIIAAKRQREAEESAAVYAAHFPDREEQETVSKTLPIYGEREEGRNLDSPMIQEGNLQPPGAGPPFAEVEEDVWTR